MHPNGHGGSDPAHTSSPFPDAIDLPLAPSDVMDRLARYMTPEDVATPGEGVAAGDDVVVEMYDFGFDPADLTVASGTTVTWTNVGGQPHNAVADDGTFATAFLSDGGSESVTLDDPGTYPYVCTLHASLMRGTITVE